MTLHHWHQINHPCLQDKFAFIDLN
jgi:hypothetical protein